ncbi:YceD family protein [Kaistia nematophila]|uniref:DUF177 domain-containing protein n=2 Tax=Kaistia TaxID=166953 RepID=A0A9X3ILA8_9HYPH|nr:DUF177 domain-containing protein [Kaistia nematophila]MCX5568655.1 DUF177 domain-containing protein [Kaistia nematophila]
MMTELQFHRHFDVSHLGNSGQKLHLVAEPAERAELAKDFDLLALDSLEADLDITPWGVKGVRVEGRLRADVVQACVITLQPVPAHIDDRFSLSFLPADAIAADPKTVAEAEVIVVYDEEDPPEPLEGNSIDFGPIVAEQLALALDPYPRAPGASLEGGEHDGGTNPGSPFAALSKLRDK